MIQYFFAIKNHRVFCFMTNEAYASDAFDFLYDKHYEMQPATKEDYLKEKSKGRAYEIDADLKLFKNGNW